MNHKERLSCFFLQKHKLSRESVRVSNVQKHVAKTARQGIVLVVNGFEQHLGKISLMANIAKI